MIRIIKIKVFIPTDLIEKVNRNYTPVFQD